MEKAWGKARSLPGMVKPSLRHNPLLGLSLFDVGPALQVINDYVDYPKAWSSPLDLAFILLNLSRGRGEILSNRDVSSAEEFRALTWGGFALPLSELGHECVGFSEVDKHAIQARLAATQAGLGVHWPHARERPQPCRGWRRRPADGR